MSQQKQKKYSWYSLPTIPTLLFAIPVLLLEIYVLSNAITGWPAYIIYTLSTYALIISLSGAVRLLRFLKAKLNKTVLNLPIMDIIRRRPLGKRFLEDALFRTELFLYIGFAINLVYVFIRLYYGIRFQSVWFTSLAVYYLMLAILRLSLLHHVRHHSTKADIKTEWQTYQRNGFLLLIMNIALAGICVLIVTKNHGYTYSDIFIYAMALYAFYSMIVAVHNVLKYRKQGSPVMSAVKIINLTSALVSMLTLETAMIAKFGNNETEFRFLMTAISGTVVCTFVLGTAVYMIVKSTLHLKT